jgi:hypothetical protein
VCDGCLWWSGRKLGQTAVVVCAHVASLLPDSTSSPVGCLAFTRLPRLPAHETASKHLYALPTLAACLANDCAIASLPNRSSLKALYASFAGGRPNARCRAAGEGRLRGRLRVVEPQRQAHAQETSEPATGLGERCTLRSVGATCACAWPQQAAAPSPSAWSAPARSLNHRMPCSRVSQAKSQASQGRPKRSAPTHQGHIACSKAAAQNPVRSLGG